jgi:hypothetical protein
MIGSYEELFSIRLAGRDIVIAEDSNIASEPYLICERSWDNPLGIDEYRNAGVSTDYLEIMREFAMRINTSIDLLEAERTERGLPHTVMTAADCIPGGMQEDMVGKVVLISASSLSPEYRSLDNQLALCTGGNGARPNARGQKVYCTELYTGKQFYRLRHNIAGVIAEEKLPEWAKGKLAALRSPPEQDSVVEKIRESKQTETEPRQKDENRKKREQEH